MKRISISLVSLLAIGSNLYAGGTFSEPVYITEDFVQAEEVIVEQVQEVYVAPAVEEYITPVIEEEYIAPVVEEVYIAPAVKEVYVPPVIVTPPPPPPAPKDIVANGLYIGLGFSAARFNPSCDCSTDTDTDTGRISKIRTDKTAGIIGRIGYDINQYIGIEARGIRTNWKSNGGKVKHAGIFIKPMLPISNKTNVYGLAGYAKTTTQGSLQTVNAKALAWGAGIEYDLSTDTAKKGRYNREFDGAGDQEGGLGVFADYERLIQKSDSPDLDTVNVGLTYDF